MEALNQDYAPQGVHFYYVYKSLAHPENNGYVQPFTLEERLMQVREANERLGTQIPWICDSMSNDVKHSLGDAPNSEFVVDPDGVVVRKRSWSNPAELRKDLEKLVGPVEHPTEAVRMNFHMPKDDENRPARGVLDRVQPASRMRAVRIEPLPSPDGLPFYAKLRAEASDALLDSGRGQLYLGFHLDPIYHVHWNNLADPLEFQLVLPENVHASPESGTGPKLDVKADVDPREFLLDVDGFTEQPIRVKVRYFACDDGETFCVPVSQEYKVFPELDNDAGWVFARYRIRQRGEQVAAGRGPAAMVKRILQRDRDGDGKISKQETPPPMRRRFDRMDANGDGFLQREELTAMAARMSRARGPGGSPPAKAAERDTQPPPDHGVADQAGSNAAAAEKPSPKRSAVFRGRFQGHIRGRVNGRLEGDFDGRLDGEIDGPLKARLNGQFRGELHGRFRGEMDGQFQGQLEGQLGAGTGNLEASGP